jgi:methionyl-tRNA synthetase
MNKNKLYITTTLPYVNADPHIAHALEFVLADIIARYYKQKLGKENVFFNVGTDEHGQKIWEKAIVENLDVHAFTDKYVARFVEFCQKFGVEYDKFYRTSKDYHNPVAQGFWNEALAQGDIYKKKYSGKYCVGCEKFILDKELVDGKCPDHGKEPIIFEEENYFFRLSKYRDQILQHLENLTQNEEYFVIPESDRNFAIEFVNNDLQDISISRDKSKLSWGVPIPNDDTQVMYVWFDALSNYIGSLFYGNSTNDFTISEARDVRDEYYFLQLCGSDNVRFQSIIWQGMLASCGIRFTDKLLVHAWILGADGRKMSKTLGNTVSPFVQIERYGSQAVRYFFAACMPTTGNAVYDENGFIDQYNAVLADNYGNLLNRVITLMNKYSIVANGTNLNQGILTTLEALEASAHRAFDQLDIYQYCKIVSEISSTLNKYITDSEPWKKDVSDSLRAEVLNTCYIGLEKVTSLYAPIVPEIASKASNMLKAMETGILVDKIEKV